LKRSVLILAQTLCVAFVLGGLFWFTNVSIYALVARDWMLYTAPLVLTAVFLLLAGLIGRTLERGAA
jgi:hypothetical protein